MNQCVRNESEDFLVDRQSETKDIFPYPSTSYYGWGFSAPKYLVSNIPSTFDELISYADNKNIKRSDVYTIFENLGFFIDEKYIQEKLRLAGTLEPPSLKAMGRGRIWLNPTETDRENIFTLAHMLGHYILHRDEKVTQQGFEESFDTLYIPQKPECRAATIFALDLLCPEEEAYNFIDSVIDNVSSKPELIEEMADYFEITETAALLRFQYLVEKMKNETQAASV